MWEIFKLVWVCCCLGWALFFSITIFEYIIRDASMKDDTMADHIMVEKFGACICWAMFYYFTH